MFSATHYATSANQIATIYRWNEVTPEIKGKGNVNRFKNFTVHLDSMVIIFQAGAFSDDTVAVKRDVEAPSAISF